MSEEKTQEQTTTENTGDGDKPQPLDKVERAEQAVKRMEEFETRVAEQIAKLEDLKAEKVLGGGSEAGATDEKKEETDAEYKERIMRGELHDGEK